MRWFGHQRDHDTREDIRTAVVLARLEMVADRFEDAADRFEESLARMEGHTDGPL